MPDLPVQRSPAPWAPDQLASPAAPEPAPPTVPPVPAVVAPPTPAAAPLPEAAAAAAVGQEARRGGKKGGKPKPGLWHKIRNAMD